MSPNPKKPKPFDADRAMAIFDDGHSIEAAVKRAVRQAVESYTPRPCPACGTPQPPIQPNARKAHA